MNEAFSEADRKAVYAAMAKRRDVRKFRADPVPDDVLARILAAAHAAPSVGFCQPWNFVIVRDPDRRQKLWEHVDAERLRAAAKFVDERREKYLQYKLEGIREAPINLCVTCDRSRHGPAVIGKNTLAEMDVYSTCTAIENIWLAARAEGVGVGWVSILTNETLHELLGIPADILPVAYLCLGYPEEFAEKPMLETTGWLPRMSLADLVFEETWNQPTGASLRQRLERPFHPDDYWPM